MISRRSLLYISLIQFVFSCLDVFARHALRGQGDFLTAIWHPWFLLWVLLQALIAPFQIRLITHHGLGRGVALMNAFSVIYAMLIGIFYLQETVSLPQMIATALVVIAVGLLLTGRPAVSPETTPTYLPSPTTTGEQDATT